MGLGALCAAPLICRYFIYPGMGLFKAKPGRASQQPPPLAPPVTHPLISPSMEKVPTWNILPSYQLYESTFSKNIHPSQEDLQQEPPRYEYSLPSLLSSTDYFSQPQVSRWENSILGNTHRMKHLQLVNSARAGQVTLEMHLLQHEGQRGVAQQPLDTSTLEYSQGDLIHGYVIICNTSLEPLPFAMFSLTFEGRVAVYSDLPPAVYKFLNMFDYKASWTPAYFDDTASEQDAIDPVDGTTVLFTLEKVLLPGVRYKKFYNFTVPRKLLDCACETHSLELHCKLLPSLGLDKEHALQDLRRARQPDRPHYVRTASSSSLELRRRVNNRVRDFSFPDTSVSYCVKALVVGKRSHYSPVAQDEFIVIKEVYHPVRVVARVEPEEEEAQEKLDQYAQLHCDIFLRDVKQNVEALVSPEKKPVSTKQVYSGCAPAPPTHAETSMLYKKKTLTQSKVLGVVTARTPYKEHVVGYVLPRNFQPRSPYVQKTTRFSVPVELTYTASSPDNKSPPDIKSVSADLVACTYRSRKYPIPVELSEAYRYQHDLEKALVQPMARCLDTIERYVEQHGPALVRFSAEQVMDIKSLANLSVKHNSFKLDAKKQIGPWIPHEDGHRLQLVVALDLSNLFPKELVWPGEDAADAGCLVPSFQSCIVGRFYYLKLQVRFSNGDALALKVGVKVEK